MGFNHYFDGALMVIYPLVMTNMWEHPPFFLDRFIEVNGSWLPYLCKRLLEGYLWASKVATGNPPTG